jgi:hypothetical protein
MEPTPDDFSKFRQQHFSAEYLKYWKIKENNFAATIQSFPSLWRLFMQLDEILLKEFEISSPLSDQRQLIPRMLMTHSHSQFRLASELAFSTCPHEAYSLMRGAIESAVFGEKLFRHPELVKVWMSRRDSELDKKEFDNHFRANRKKNLFTGKSELEKLHVYWVQWSELSSHSSMEDMARRTQMESAPGAENFVIHYFERDQRYVCLAAFQALEAMALIESLLYTMFEGRLQLHPTLADERQAFARGKEAFRQGAIRDFGIRADGSMTKA